MNTWLRSRSWWFELLIYWVALTSWMFFADWLYRTVTAATSDSADRLPITGLIMAAVLTGVGRWRRRHNRSRDNG
jgi:MYXO-CTERM domain-containing protein